MSIDIEVFDNNLTTKKVLNTCETQSKYYKNLSESLQVAHLEVRHNNTEGVKRKQYIY